MMNVLLSVPCVGEWGVKCFNVCAVTACLVVHHVPHDCSCTGDNVEQRGREQRLGL